MGLQGQLSVTFNMERFIAVLFIERRNAMRYFQCRLFEPSGLHPPVTISALLTHSIGPERTEGCSVQIIWETSCLARMKFRIDLHCGLDKAVNSLTITTSVVTWVGQLNPLKLNEIGSPLGTAIEFSATFTNMRHVAWQGEAYRGLSIGARFIDLLFTSN